MLVLHQLLSFLLVTLVAVKAQSPTPSTNASASATPSTNASAVVITTTVLSVLPTSSGQSRAQTTTLVLTLTLNATALQTPSDNGSLAGNGSMTNATLSGNETAIPWNSTMDYLPFKIVIDPAYGVLGGLLILTGVPVAVLGGKNRWSSLAIASGYTLMVFTLVMVLRFGVEPAMEGPSPNPPSRTLRGLYLLASIIAALVGSGIGIFFWKFAQYWVGAAGGFALGWFIMATKADGVVTKTVARWGLMGGLTLAAFLAGLHPKITPFMLLASTAWIGATAFTLGIDCFTRGGLKEFYVYNLGFHGLFPKLGDDKYPLTQTMQVELGVLAAMVVIGAAVQFKVLNMLQAKLKQMRDLEAAREEAAEEAKAAERFKDVKGDLSEWEAKYGKGSGPGSPAVPQLGFSEGGPSSSASLLAAGRLDSPSLDGAREHLPPMELGDRSLSPDSTPMEVLGSSGPSDPELESKMKLLAEVQRVRRDVRGSIDQLRSGTPSSFGDSRRVSISSGRLLDTPGGSPSPSPTVPVAPGKSEWDAYLQERKLVTPPSGITPPIPTSAMPGSRRSEYVVVSEGVARALDRRQRTMSAFELSGRTPTSEWGVGGSKSTTMPASASAAPLRERPPASDGDSPITSSFPPSNSIAPPVIIGHAKAPIGVKPAPPQRTLTYDELDARHRRRLSKLQEPVTSKMKEEVDVAEARDKWAKMTKLEREEMKRRERDRVERLAERERHGDDAHGTREAVLPRVPRLSATKKTEEWRQSVSCGLDTLAQPTRKPQPRPESHRQSKGFVN